MRKKRYSHSCDIYQLEKGTKDTPERHTTLLSIKKSTISTHKITTFITLFSQVSVSSLLHQRTKEFICALQRPPYIFFNNTTYSFVGQTVSFRRTNCYCSLQAIFLKEKCRNHNSTVLLFIYYYYFCLLYTS